MAIELEMKTYICQIRKSEFLNVLCDLNILFILLIQRYWYVTTWFDKIRIIAASGLSTCIS